MHVIFVEPGFPYNQREFVRGLHSVGAFVTGIGERPLEFLDDELRGWLGAYEQVSSVVHEPALHEAVRRVQGRGWVDRIEATLPDGISVTGAAFRGIGLPACIRSASTIAARTTARVLTQSS